jgi:DNA replication protein DnaC
MDLNSLGKIYSQVGRGKAPCPVCFGEGRRASEGRMVECPCRFFKEFFRELDKNVLVHHRETKLNELAPSTLSRLPAEQQTAVISRLQSAPDNGWAFFGPAGLGKTTYTTALYRRALQENLMQTYGKAKPVSVWRVSVKQLTDEFREQSMTVGQEEMKPVTPTVSRAKIKLAVANGVRPKLFLEEVDKISLTDFRRDSLFEIFSVLHEANGQLVLNSNLSMQSFGDVYGDTFAWRVREMCNVEDFFSGKSLPAKGKQKKAQLDMMRQIMDARGMKVNQ